MTSALPWSNATQRNDAGRFQLTGLGFLYSAICGFRVWSAPGKGVGGSHHHFVFSAFRQAHGGSGCLCCQRPPIGPRQRLRLVYGPAVSFRLV